MNPSANIVLVMIVFHQLKNLDFYVTSYIRTCSNETSFLAICKVTRVNIGDVRGSYPLAKMECRSAVMSHYTVHEGDFWSPSTIHGRTTLKIASFVRNGTFEDSDEVESRDHFCRASFSFGRAKENEQQLPRILK